MARVLVTEEIAESGLQALRDAGHHVDVRLKLSPEELLDAVQGAQGLVIRSSTQVTADVLDRGRDLMVVGRAGIGLDNVDVDAATERGVMVVNAPTSNIISAAEHAISLLMSQARNVPQASAALKAGRWERSKWEGVELYEKTLGIVGLGRIGALVAQRMSAFGMNLVAYDPYISADKAQALGCELMSLEDVMACSDFITVHLPKTPETIGLLNKELLEKSKPGIRIVNAARGGIVDEEALAEAIRNGHVGGAGLDVFSTEPATESPLFELDSVVVTPHLGASTAEAQDKAGVTIAEQVGLALAGDFVPFAVNVNAAEPPEAVKPYLGLAEHLGAMFTNLVGGNVDDIEVSYRGSIAELDTRLLTLAVQKGFVGQHSELPVSFVNVGQIAAERGLEVRETKSSKAKRYALSITVRSADRSIAGTLNTRDEPRIIMVNDVDVELPPSDHMLVVRNSDQPGMVGKVGTVLGQAGVNISDMALGRDTQTQSATMVIALDEPVTDEVRKALQDIPGMTTVAVLKA